MHRMPRPAWHYQREAAEAARDVHRLSRMPQRGGNVRARESGCVHSICFPQYAGSEIPAMHFMPCPDPWFQRRCEVPAMTQIPAAVFLVLFPLVAVAQQIAPADEQ